MRRLVGLAVIVMSLHAAQVAVGEKYKNSQKCKACHSHLVQQWEMSWHAKSHYDNDEYLRKSIDYVARKSSGKSLNTIKVECAQCHNPRIAVTTTSAEYEAIAALNLDKGTSVTKALESDAIAEGINCVVCHNIDKIHDELPDTKRGISRVEWMPSGIMSGPFDDAKSPYHKTERREFMDSNPNQLCFVCHANDKSEEGLRFFDMQSEFKGGGKQCVECHMSPRKEGVAATLRNVNGQTHQRLIREHGFKGGHVESMWKGALSVSARKSASSLEVTLNNPQPHPLPSGFGSREILVDVQYLKGGKALRSESVSLTSRYLSRHNQPTIPHLAKKETENAFVPAKGSKTLSIPLPAGSDQAVVSVSYRLVNDEVRGILDLKDPIWSKKMLIQRVVVKL